MPLIVFEGIDGSGTTTHAHKLYGRIRGEAPALKSEHLVRLTSQPTTSAIGTFVRQIFEGTYGSELPFWKQMVYLFQADREGHAIHLKKWLDQGTTVISDRYWMSAMAYQVASAVQAGENQFQVADWISRLNEEMPQPSVTFLLDVSVEEALRRQEKSADLYQKGDFLEQVRQLYLQMKAKRIEVIDTESLNVEETQQHIVKVLGTLGIL